MAPAKRRRSSSGLVQSRRLRTFEGQAKDQNETTQPMSRREERLSEFKKRREELELRDLLEEEQARQRTFAEKLAKVQRTGNQQTQPSFPFLALPPELREMVYSYLVVSSAALEATDGQWNRSHSVPMEEGLSLAIMRVSKQVSAEAIALFYRENLVMVRHTCYEAPYFRRPVLRTDLGPPRLHNLRNGYIGKVRHVGAIYPHIFPRFRHLDFEFDIRSNARNNDTGDILSYWKGAMKTYVDLLLSEPNANGISLHIEVLRSSWREKTHPSYFLQHYDLPIEALEVESDLEAYFKQLQTSMLKLAGR